ncbi:YutD family protein [Enterococcus avium]|uniref:YutD family protein n=1 Tax=Enterococcus avium TaxID=33945 RepID=UPI00288D3CFC|nr:YutD family protein [Enterococcus avium]MDT2426851.1 YutD family protein [Enterococcus avium]MDT2457956.1 YutD family protein [Enterococcus avium]
MAKEKRDKKEQKNNSEKTVTEELAEVLDEIVETPAEEKKKGETVVFVDDSNLLFGERQYRLVRNYREGFDAERLGERFSEVLTRYDYIVGDWGYDQLRLKGFFREDDRKSLPEQRIDTLEDYLYEYCNFGCAYFVLERTGGKRQQTRKKRKCKRKDKSQAYVEEKKVPVTNKPKKKPVIKNRQPKKETPTKTKEKDERFVIRQREE